MSSFFITYSRNDSYQVKQIIDALEKIEHDVWIDTERISGGTEWWEEICRAIREKDYYIFIISPASLSSEYCLTELNYAVNLKK